MKLAASHSRLHRGISILATIILMLAVSAGLLAWWKYYEHKQEANVLVSINGKDITLQEVSLLLRANVWRQGLNWPDLEPETQTRLREETLQQFISQTLIQQHLGNANSTPSLEGEEAFQQFIKQFEDPDTWLDRANLQNLDELKLRELLNSATQLTASVEAEILKRLKPVTQEEAQLWYKENQSQFLIPESARASQIFLTRHDPEKPDRSFEIAELRRALTAGETTFSQAASQSSDDDRSNKKGGDLGWFSRARVPEDFAAFTFGLSAGQTSAPFETRLGWHIVWMKEKRPARTARFDEVKNEVMAILGERKRENALNVLMDELRHKYPVTVHTERLVKLESSY